jgi:NAD(P)-dependent dehydrogenase (short-subunit alcohol dehydrogenase family)
MGNLCAGRVAIVTGAGRGLGREYALMLAEQGAKVVVNDLGATAAGEGSDLTPAQSVVEAIREAGGEAIVNGNDVSDWTGAKALIDEAIATFGKLDVLINNAGILRDRMMVNMTEQEWDSVIKVHLKGTFAPSHHAAHYWRQEAKRQGSAVSARLINTSSASGLFGNVGQTQLRGGQGGHRRVHDHQRHRTQAVRYHRQRHCATRADPNDRRPETAQQERNRAPRSTLGRTDRGLAGQRAIRRRDRPRVRSRRRNSQSRRGLACRPGNRSGRGSE